MLHGDSRGKSTKDIERVKAISSGIDKRLESLSNKTTLQLDGLNEEELRDLGKLVDIANYMLVKYADKKEMYDLLKPFADIIQESAESLSGVEDEISETLLSAQTSFNRMSEMHSCISDGADLQKKGDSDDEQ